MQEPNEVERESLKDEMRTIVEEARMVIPGVQALFGFQTMAVFNQRFEDLPTAGLVAYLAGLVLLAVSIALLMTPAAYHRIAERGEVSQHMVNLASRLITFGMVPLALALALDAYVVFLAALGGHTLAVVVGVASLVLFVSAWFVFPGAARRSMVRPGMK